MGSEEINYVLTDVIMDFTNVDTLRMILCAVPQQLTSVSDQRIYPSLE